MKREPEAVEQYLRGATRGLWGRKRREVREELQAHLEERVLTHRVGGMDEDRALKRAIAELGDPGRVRAGMLRLYTLPAVMGSGLASFVVLLAVVSLWPKGAAQTLNVSSFWPSRQCIQALGQQNEVLQEQTCFSNDYDFWMSQRALREALESQGVTFKTVLGPAAKLLSVTVPGTTPVFLTLSSSETLPASIFVNGQTIYQDEGYLSFWNLIDLFARNEDTRLKISGWDDPTVSLNDVTFHLRDESNPVSGRAFFWAYFMNVVAHLAPDLAGDPPALTLDADNLGRLKAPRQQASFEVLGEAGDVYGLMSYVKMPSRILASPPREEATLVFQLSRADQEGRVHFYFVEGERTLTEAFTPGSNLKVGESVLVHLAGGNPQAGGWYEVVTAQIQK